MQTLSKDEMNIVVQMNRMGISSFVFVEIVFFIIWFFALGVPGFALYDGSVNTISAFTHAMWWMFIEFGVIICGVGSTWFGLGYDPKKQRFERNVSRSESWIDLYCVLLPVGAVANLIHFILTMFEVTNCSSTLCKDHFWVIVCLLIFLMVLVILQILQIFRVRSYKHNLHMAMTKLDASLGDDEEQENDLETPLLPSAPPQQQMLTTSRIRDPHGFQKKIKK
jgi:hypothetical protein